MRAAVVIRNGLGMMDEVGTLVVNDVIYQGVVSFQYEPVQIVTTMMRMHQTIR
jgi:hypothetical protein